MPDTTVQSGSELIDEIQANGEGYVIDATDVSSVDVPSGTTLEGDGVTVMIDDDNPKIFEQRASDVTFRGINFWGHVKDDVEQDGYWDYPDGDSAWAHDATAIHVYSDSCVVEECTFAGWTFAGVRIGEYGGSVWTPTIRNCEFVNNNCRALGYGVVVYSGYPVIEWNYFNNNRHDLAGGGDHDICGYEARYNHLGDVGRIYGMEMHEDGGWHVHIHHNTFEHKVHHETGDDRILVQNRGVPSEPENCEVNNNWFKNPDRNAVIADNPDEYYQFSDNHFGADEPAADVGQPRGSWYDYPRTRFEELDHVLFGG